MSELRKSAADLNLDLFSMDLQSQEAGEMKNTWIREHTGGLLGNGEPAPWPDLTVMVIMNSVYFDKDWRIPFEGHSTYEQTFYKTDGYTVTCEMMHSAWDGYDYLQTDTYLASALPYKDNSYMLFMLPEEGVDIGDLLKSDLQSADTGLAVSDIIQTARIQVDENGTRAAAVTEITTEEAEEIEKDIVYLTLDRPYVYAIVSANGTILFAGVVNDPTVE